MPPPPPPPRRKANVGQTSQARQAPPPVPTKSAPPPVPTRTVGFAPPPIPPRSAGGAGPPPPPPRKRNKSRISRVSAPGKRSSVSRLRAKRVGRCRWMKRNWILLCLAGLALAGFVLAGLLYLEPCPLVERKTKVTKLSPVDVVFLLDASGSMNDPDPSPWLKQAEAASLILTTLMTSSNHTTNGTFQASIVQWSGDERYDPGTNAIHIDQQLTNNVTKVVEDLQAPLTQSLSSWTFFSPALVECEKQLSTSSQQDSFKLCILMTDGINNDNDDFLYPPTSSSGVGQWCLDQNITSKSAPEIDLCKSLNYNPNDAPGVPPANSCTNCVGSEDGWCSTNLWDAQCVGKCASTACAPSCKGVCTTARIADFMHDEMGIKMAGVLVSGSIASTKLAKATETVQQVSSCKNETELAKGTCPYFVEADDFDELTSKATTIASALASEIMAETSEKTAFVCLGSPEFLSFLVLAFPLVFYLLFKPSSFAVRKVAHNLKTPPPLPPRMTVAIEKAEDEVIEPEIVVMEEEDEVVEAPPTGSPPKVAKKRFKWEIQSNDKYLWANEKGLGHMPVDFSTKNLGNSLPPSAPKDKDLTKGKKILREALHWETADKYEQEQIEQVIKYEEEEEELEVRLSNIYNGDDVAEAIADAVIDNVVDPIGKYLCCGYCCGLCGCLERTLCCCCGGDEYEEGDGSISTRGSADEGHVAMKAVV